MAPIAKATLLNMIDTLLAKGGGIMRGGSSGTSLVSIVPFAEFRAGCLNVLSMIGPRADIWKPDFAPDTGYSRDTGKMFGTLTAIRAVVDGDLLVSIEDLAFADAFASLLEQAEHLNDQGYHIAAAVLGRAVLEEHLRRMCLKLLCPPTKAKPTLADYKAVLYRATHLSKIEQSHIESLAAVGNTAAHNTGPITKTDADRLLRDVRDFLTKHPA